MDVLKSLNWSMRVTGFGEEGRIGIQVYVYLLTQVIMLVNITYFVMMRWQDVDDRINGLKAAILLVTYIAYAVSFVCCWDHFFTVIQTFHQLHFQIPFTVSLQRRLLMDLLRNRMERFNRNWKLMVTAYLVPFNTFPAAIVFIRVFLFSEQFHRVIRQTRSLPFPFYYPETALISETSTYFTAYVIHCAYMVFVGFYVHLTFTTILGAMSNVEFEFKLLRLSLMEMHQLIREATEQQILDLELRKFGTYFVLHHQSTYRRFEVVNRGIRWVAAILSTTASLYMCMSIYTIVQKDQVLLKLQESLFLGLWAYAIYLIDNCGEKIKTEDEELRKAFYECDWWDKPQWFKSSLFISMTRATKSTTINPFGLFSLNLNSFATTMNAVYSYYNLLNKFNSNITVT